MSRGANAETLSEGLTAMLGNVGSDRPVGVALASDVLTAVGGVDTRLAASVFAEANELVFALADTSDLALSDAATDITSYGAVALAADRGQTAVTYGAGVDVALLGLMSAQNLENALGTLTPYGKGVPGVTASDLTDAQFANLDAKRINHVARVYGANALLGGFTSRHGHWIDAVWWNIWLKDRIQRAIWNAIRGSRRLTRALLGGRPVRRAAGGSSQRRHPAGPHGLVGHQGRHHRHHGQPELRRDAGGRLSDFTSLPRAMPTAPVGPGGSMSGVSAPR